ncbi:MAG: pyridoxal-phosphate dependent enzyme [Bdellovibrionota bacterium]
MQFYNNILEAIGKTPLVKLNKVVPKDSAEIFVKCEYMNPTGSIKDRMAYYIVEQAEKEGLLKPGGTIVENTSGNTGLGVAMTAAVKGYRCVFTMPDKMSTEKVNMLKAYGAEVIITPTDVPGDSPEHYVNVAKRIAKDTPNSYYVNQYHNQSNIAAHYHSTGKEIWEETNGEFDVFMGGTGTGGTVSGIGRYLKEKKPEIQIIGVDPIGSVHYHLFHTGTLPTAHVYKVEGIGEDIKCDAMDFSYVDDMLQVNDKESFDMARRLVRDEGLFCGGSSGSIVHCAVKLARQLGSGKKIICVLPDSATRYITKHLADSWMKDYGFMEPNQDLGLVEDLIANNKRTLITAEASDTVGDVISKLKNEGISQVPILDGNGKPSSMVHEEDILQALQTGKATRETLVSDISSPIGGLIYPKARIEEIYRIFDSGRVAIVVDQDKVVGILSKIDIIEFISKKLGN